MQPISRLLTASMLSALLCTSAFTAVAAQKTWIPFRGNRPSRHSADDKPCLQWVSPAKLDPLTSQPGGYVRGWKITLTLDVLRPDLAPGDDFLVEWQPLPTSTPEPGDWEHLELVEPPTRAAPLVVNFLFDLDADLLAPGTQDIAIQDNQFWRVLLEKVVTPFDFNGTATSDEGYVYNNCACDGRDPMIPLATAREEVTMANAVFNHMIRAVHCAYFDTSSRPRNFEEMKSHDFWVIFSLRKDPPDAKTYLFHNRNRTIYLVIGRSLEYPLGDAEWEQLKNLLKKDYNVEMLYAPILDVIRNEKDLEDMLAQAYRTAREEHTRLKIQAVLPKLLDEAAAQKVIVRVRHAGGNCLSEPQTLSVEGLPISSQPWDQTVLLPTLVAFLFLSHAFLLTGILGYKYWPKLREEIDERFQMPWTG
jgi:hypothetical protein